MPKNTKAPSSQIYKVLNAYSMKATNMQAPRAAPLIPALKAPPVAGMLVSAAAELLLVVVSGLDPADPASVSLLPLGVAVSEAVEPELEDPEALVVVETVAVDRVVLVLSEVLVDVASEVEVLVDLAVLVAVLAELVSELELPSPVTTLMLS